jgi:hypothetical protein
MNLRFAAASPLPLALFLAPRTSFADEKVPGEEWEATTKMSMPGMPMQMPARTSKFCRAKSKAWDEPPMDRQSQDRCKMSDYRLVGNHATWKMTCDGGMSGTGDMTFQTDSYAGTMIVSMEGGSMKMDLSGRKTGVECDAMEMQRTIDRAKKQAAEAEEYVPGGSKDPMIAICNEGAASGNRSLFIGPSAQCKKPDQKAVFCRNAVTRKAFDTYVREGQGQMTVVSEVASFCGTTADAVVKDLCPKALDTEDLTFLAMHCPGQAKPLAQKYCAGRKFTTIAEDTIRAFCSSYAEKLLAK